MVGRCREGFGTAESASMEKVDVDAPYKINNIQVPILPKNLSRS